MCLVLKIWMDIYYVTLYFTLHSKRLCALILDSHDKTNMIYGWTAPQKTCHDTNSNVTSLDFVLSMLCKSFIVKRNLLILKRDLSYFHIIQKYFMSNLSLIILFTFIDQAPCWLHVYQQLKCNVCPIHFITMNITERFIFF